MIVQDSAQAFRELADAIHFSPGNSADAKYLASKNLVVGLL